MAHLDENSCTKYIKIMWGYRVIVGVICALGLVCVRAFEGVLFYDPFLEYFKEANSHFVIPSYDLGKLVGHHILRFLANFIFSIGVIWVFFGKKYLYVSGVLMVGFFVLCFPMYIFMVETGFEYGYQLGFYLRRFVIQPLLLLLLLPMFYYIEKTKG